MNATDNIATDLFYKIRSRFRGLKLGSENGTITIKPNEARFFDFDYMEGEMPIGHISISLAEPNSMKVYFSTGITEEMDQPQKANWYKFLKELRQFSKRRLMAFDTRDISKDNLDERDYAFLSQNAQQQQNKANSEPVGESVMNESAMYGTKTMSFQKLMDTRLIIKHSQSLVDDTQPGARTRHISALFVENQDGERFKYPFIHLAGSRAMQRHVANGGVPYDDVGKSIISMSEQIAQLKSFNNYVVRNDLMNSDTNNIVERSSTALDTLREQIKKLAKQGYYESYIESFQQQEMPEVPQDVIEDFTQKFTVRNFKEDIKTVFPVLYRLMQESDNTIDYDDIIEMTSDDEDVQESSEVTTYDPFSKFEDWAMTLGERSSIQDPEQQEDAVRELQELMGQHFPAGVDGTNAIESLSGIIEDPALQNQIEQAAKEDPEQCVRPIVKQWLEDNVPDVVQQIDFGDMDEQDYEDPMAYADASADADADYYGRQEGIEEAGNQKKFDTTMWVSNPEFTINAGDDDETEEEIEVGVNYESTIVDQGYAPSWGDSGGDPGEGATFEAEIYDVVDLATGKKIGDPSVIEYIKDKIEQGGYDYYQEDVDGAKKSDVPAALRKSKDNKDWKLSTQDLEKEKERNISSSEYLKKQNESVDTNELAEFISSFYDKDSGTFPKGPEGVATMVGKKFGERAERAARKMVERMAPQQSDPQISELSRIRELSGMQTEATHQFKKGDKVRVKNDKSGEVFTVYNLAGAGDSPDTVYLQQPEKSVATRASMASGLELVPDETAAGFKKGEQVKYKGKYVKDLGDVVTYRRPDMRNPNEHWVETKSGPFSVATSELEKLDGKIVAMPEQLESEPVPELEDIKHLSGITQGIRFR